MMSTAVIRYRLKSFLRLLLVCIVIGIFNFTCAVVALNYARVEKPDIRIRDVRFNLVEIQSPQYHFYRRCCTYGKLIGDVFAAWCVVPFVLYLRALGYSKSKTTLWCLSIFLLPVINLFILLYLIQKADDREEEIESTS